MVQNVEMHEIQDKSLLLKELNEIVDAVNGLEVKVNKLKKELAPLGPKLSLMNTRIENLMKGPKKKK